MPTPRAMLSTRWGAAIAPLITMGGGYRESFPTHDGAAKVKELGYACLNLVVTAKNAGATGKDTFKFVVDSKRHDSQVKWTIAEKSGNAWTYETNFYEARQFCYGWVQTGALDDLRQHIYYSDGWQKALDDLPQTEDALEAKGARDGAQRALEQGDDCAKMVDEAVTAELKPETAIELGSSKPRSKQKTTITLAEVKDKICAPS